MPACSFCDTGTNHHQYQGTLDSSWFNRDCSSCAGDLNGATFIVTATTACIWDGTIALSCFGGVVVPIRMQFFSSGGHLFVGVTIGFNGHSTVFFALDLSPSTDCAFGGMPVTLTSTGGGFFSDGVHEYCEVPGGATLTLAAL